MSTHSSLEDMYHIRDEMVRREEFWIGTDEFNIRGRRVPYESNSFAESELHATHKAWSSDVRKSKTPVNMEGYEMNKEREERESRKRERPELDERERKRERRSSDYEERKKRYDYFSGSEPSLHSDNEPSAIDSHQKEREAMYAEMNRKISCIGDMCHSISKMVREVSRACTDIKEELREERQERIRLYNKLVSRVEDHQEDIEEPEEVYSRREGQRREIYEEPTRRGERVYSRRDRHTEDRGHPGGPKNDRCFRCGDNGHHGWQCPLPPDTKLRKCYKCQEYTTHIAINCPGEQNGRGSEKRGISSTR